MKEELRPARCACGCRAGIYYGTNHTWVECDRYRGDCWVGPKRKVEATAIRAWNKVMGEPLKKGKKAKVY